MTVEELALKWQDTDARCKSNTHRIGELSTQTDAISRLATAVEVMATEQKHQTQAIVEIKTDVSDLDAKVVLMEQKPGKRWDGLLDKILWAVAAAIITFFLARLGL